MRVRNIGASIRDRLLNKARAEKLDYNLLLTRYALERLLYRLSISEQRDQFLLKGALLFGLWFDVPHRPTHDADFLGFGSAEIPHLEEVFRDISRIEVEDGIVFQPDSVKAAEIRKEANYAGVRVTLIGLLDSARCPVQIDIGFGDAVVPGPVPQGAPIGLSDEFINDAQKEKQWQAFLRKNARDPMSLAAMINDLREFLLPVLATATTSSSHDMAWRAGEGWR